MQCSVQCIVAKKQDGMCSMLLNIFKDRREKTDVYLTPLLWQQLLYSVAPRLT